MSDFKEIPRLLTTEESRKLIRRFGDPHEQEHSMAERFAIADALEAANKRIAELEAENRALRSAFASLRDRLTELSVDAEDAVIAINMA
jgi:uncharacterized coiled-coil DUF342 family protein